MLNEKIIAKTALVDTLIYNNRFSNRMVKGDQIGAEDFDTWKKLVENVRKPAYELYAANEDHADKATKDNAKNAACDALKVMFKVIGELTLFDADGNPHGAPITLDDDFVDGLADLCSNYASKMGKEKAPALQLVESRIRNTTSDLKKYSNVNGINPEYLAQLEEDLKALNAEKSNLMDTPDMCTDKPMVASESAFRKKFEHHLARFLKGKKAQSWEEYLAEKEARRQERRQRTTDKKKAEKEAKKA